jgi:hypothetical protein
MEFSYKIVYILRMFSLQWPRGADTAPAPSYCLPSITVRFMERYGHIHSISGCAACARQRATGGSCLPNSGGVGVVGDGGRGGARCTITFLLWFLSRSATSALLD